MRRLAPTVAVVVTALLVASCSSGPDERGDGGPATSTTSTTADDADPPTTVSTTTTTTSVPALPPRPPEPPDTAVWVHLFDDTLTSPAGVEAMLEEVSAAGIDAVIAQVARRHDAYYDSAHLPATPDPALTPGFDVLDALVTGAHERGMQLHAWFVVAPGYHHAYDDLELPTGHVWLDHGPDSTDPWMTVAHDGTVSESYFDVGLDAVHEHVAAIVADLARYPIDGVHLDYARYDGERWGYHPDALARFASDTGRTDRPGPGDPEWVRWRRARTATLVERARSALEATRPDALLSAAVIAGGPGPSALGGDFLATRAGSEMFQDWPAWVEEGTVDFVLAMAYLRESVPEHAAWFRQWVDFAATLAQRHPGRVGIGVGAYLNSADAALDQTALVRSRVGTLGVYSYQQDSADEPRGTVLASCCGP